MNLKKSDKMIAVIGVIILVIAAIGIIMFVPEEDTNGDGDNGADDYSKFYVKYNLENDKAMVEPDPVGQKITEKIIGDGSYVGETSVPSKELQYVEFYVDYEDSIMLKRLGQMGGDILTFAVFDESDNQLDSKKIVGMGNDTIKINVGTPLLSIREIVAKDIYDAGARLEENLTDTEMTYNYKIQVSLNQKETVLRPLAWLLEKVMQDKFTLTVTYYYYDYYVEKIDDDDDGDDTGDETPADSDVNKLSLTYLSTNYIGYH